LRVGDVENVASVTWICEPSMLGKRNTFYIIPHGGLIHFDTVNGRNPTPVDMANVPLFTGFYTSQVVVWDFTLQQ